MVWNDAWRKIEQSTWDLNAEWVCLKKPAWVLYETPRMRPYCTLYLVSRAVSCTVSLRNLLHYTFKVFYWLLLQQINQFSKFIFSVPQSYKQPNAYSHFWKTTSKRTDEVEGYYLTKLLLSSFWEDDNLMFFPLLSTVRPTSCLRCYTQQKYIENTLNSCVSFSKLWPTFSNNHSPNGPRCK